MVETVRGVGEARTTSVCLTDPHTCTLRTLSAVSTSCRSFPRETQRAPRRCFPKASEQQAEVQGMKMYARVLIWTLGVFDLPMWKQSVHFVMMMEGCVMVNIEACNIVSGGPDHK